MKRFILKALSVLLIATTVYAVEATKNVKKDVHIIAKTFRGF